MGLDETIDEFNNRCKKLNNLVASFSEKYDSLETKYDNALKNLWSAKSQITLLQTNLEQLALTNEKTKLLSKVLEEILDRIDKIEETIKNIESEFLE